MPQKKPAKMPVKPKAALTIEQKFNALRNMRVSAAKIDNYRAVFVKALQLGFDRQAANKIANDLAGTNYS